MSPSANGSHPPVPRTGVQLPSVAVMYAGFSSRVVGATKLKDVVVHLPVTTR